MKLLYINDELATGDGSNSHAVGMLEAFESILGKENVRSYPKAIDGSNTPINLKAEKLKGVLKTPLAVLRYFRKKYLSVKKSKMICRDLKEQGFTPTHVLARSTIFDVTAIYVAQEFNAKLVYEVNTPMFFERGIIKKEPMIRQIEAWEKRIIEASDFVYVVSNICKEMLCNRYAVSANKFVVIPNGYMEDLYHENENERISIRTEVREKEELTDKFVVTFVGSLKVWHGIKSFCEAAQKLEKEKDIMFLVLGDGEMHDMITNYISCHNNMIFKGKVNLETMKRYLYASDLGIMPYEKKENFYYSPLKMFDMIGAELPFIGTSVGQIEEICKSTSMDECLINDNSAQTIADKILNLKTSMMTNGFNRADYTWKKRTELLLEKMCDQ